MTKALPAVALATMLLAACGANGSSGKTDTSGTSTSSKTANPKPTDTIEISDYLYAPTPAKVRVGQRIAIVNSDQAPHTLTDKAARRAFDSGTVKAKGRGSVTFRKPGTYVYFCQFHATMKGTVTVVR